MRSSRQAAPLDVRRTARQMSLLTGLFGCRVLGQALVTANRATFLPPMEQWQSGLLPYPVLLTSQVAIFAVQSTIDAQACRGRGRLVEPMPRFGRALGIVSRGYAAAMVARYVLTMRRHPEWRWFGHTIPIAFHCILAAYLGLYARLLTAPDPRLSSAVREGRGGNA